jgi:hypothetical protein
VLPDVGLPSTWFSAQSKSCAFMPIEKKIEKTNVSKRIVDFIVDDWKKK